MPKYYIKTFGCQMNEHDSLQIGSLLHTLQYEQAKGEEEADLLLFNTCTIREKAHQKAFSEVGRALSASRKRNPKPLIGVCGCVAQEVGAGLLKRFPGIDLLFGPDQIDQLPHLLELHKESQKPVMAVDLMNEPKHYHFLDLVDATRIKSGSAYVTIMKGCNSHCSYCIVPKVRGTEVYRPAGEIVKEVEWFVQKGCKEVILLGQNVNSYLDTSRGKISFAQLVRRVGEETAIERIRFTSPHPKDVRGDLIEEYAANPKLISYLHLPVQSGSDGVLRRMRRAYNRRQYLEKINALRAARPDISFTTDIIVGFPGETEADFEQTLSLLEEVEFDNIYGFKYSPRPGTEAFQWADHVSLEAKEKRLERLFHRQAVISKRRNTACIGSLQKVLVEGPDRLQRQHLTGRSYSFKIVHFEGAQELVGDIVPVYITSAHTYSLLGERRPYVS